MQTLFSQIWWSLSRMFWRNHGMNSNGVGVPPLFFLTMIFMEAGKEVWNPSFLFCPPASWMQINHFVRQRQKPEHQPWSQNEEMVRNKETIFQISRGKDKVCLMYVPSKKETSPWSSDLDDSRISIWYVCCLKNNPQSYERAIPGFSGAQENNLRKTSVKGLPTSLWDFVSENEPAKHRRHWNWAQGFLLTFFVVFVIVEKNDFLNKWSTIFLVWGLF